jgi:WXG100 family type VII secretion target
VADIQANYETLTEMSKIFRNGARQLGDTSKSMEDLAGKMEGGALLGAGGDLFANALRARLSPRIKKLQDKFNELAQDVAASEADMKQADKNGADRFR